VEGWSASGVSRTWGSSKRPRKRSKTGQMRASCLQCLGGAAGQNNAADGRLHRDRLVEAGCSRSGPPGVVAQRTTRGGQTRELTNVEQHDLRRSPSREIEGRGSRHVVVSLLSRER
jgi:hypothetical protein